MTREELLDYTYFLIKHIGRGVTPAWLVDKYMDTEHPLPPAEGAEEILQKTTLSDTSVPNVPLSWLIAPESPTWNAVIAAMQEFATLHAQRLAEKMVSERLREELIAYDKWIINREGMGEAGINVEQDVDIYIKTRER